LKNILNKKPAEAADKVGTIAGFLIGLIFDREDGGNISL
jgi:hypothetical protein